MKAAGIVLGSVAIAVGVSGCCPWWSTTLSMASYLKGLQSEIVSLTLNAEAGHTYRVNANAEWGERLPANLGTTQLGRWNPVFEDVTGKGFVGRVTRRSGPDENA